MGAYYGHRWAWGSDLEIRGSAEKYYIYTKHYFPYKKVLPIVRRNGYKGSFGGLQGGYFCELILSDPKAETLLKAKQKHLLEAYYDIAHKIKKYWPSIKIAIRHSYIIPNRSDWFDHLSELEYLNKDILNPKLICSIDFHEEHLRIVGMANKLRAKRAYKQEKAEIAQAEITYHEAKNKFFNLKFEKGDISIAPLTSVREFYEEGEALHHCVTSFYKKGNSLILSAKKNGERLETVQVKLNDFRVAQSRGLQNKHTKHHREVVSLVESNMKQIKRASKTNTP